MLTNEEVKLLNSLSFSNVSSIYKEEVSAQNRFRYLRDMFTDVRIDDNRAKLLEIDWPYVYTLNLDDAIEKNSKFNHIIYANRDVRDDIYNEEKCVIKLHGDVDELLTYTDSKSEVFSRGQYAESIHRNRSLLNKLRHDATCMNLVYIGCSLDDEFDLLAYAGTQSDLPSVVARYFLTVGRPNFVELSKYRMHGITHVVQFDDYDQINYELYNLWIEAQKIGTKDLVSCRQFAIRTVPRDYESNKPYLFHGKSQIDKHGILSIPFFFITRDVTQTIISNLKTCTIQFVVGNSCSGKTYIMFDIMRLIRDRDVFLFQSKERLTDEAFETLNHSDNCLILFDTNVLTTDQIEKLIRLRDRHKANNVTVIIFASRKNRDLPGLVRLLELQGVVEKDEIKQISTSNSLNRHELDCINELLPAIRVGIYEDGRTIVDNLIHLSERLMIQGKYSKIAPYLRSERDLAVLIALATKQKVYAMQVVGFGLMREMHDLLILTDPLVEEETTWSFEQDAADNSQIKYIVNAEYWLYDQLANYAKKSENVDVITKAYQYLVSQMYQQAGSQHSYNKGSLKDYILFDKINEIFCGRGFFGLRLIQRIYEGLNDILSSEPHYMHQRSKCYLRSAYYSSIPTERDDWLVKAFRDANVSVMIFQQEYDRSNNDKIAISIAHVNYTLAVIQCRICIFHDRLNEHENNRAIEVSYLALTSPYNSHEYVWKESKSDSSIIRDLIIIFCSDEGPDKYGISMENKRRLSEMIKMMPPDELT